MELIEKINEYMTILNKTIDMHDHIQNMIDHI